LLGTTVTVASASAPANRAAVLLTEIVMVVDGTSPWAVMAAGVSSPRPETCRLASGALPGVPAALRYTGAVMKSPSSRRPATARFLRVMALAVTTPPLRVSAPPLCPTRSVAAMRASMLACTATSVVLLRAAARARSMASETLPIRSARDVLALVSALRAASTGLARPATATERRKSVASRPVAAS
jgi:hypothetical protein